MICFFMCVLPRNKLIGTSFLFIYRLLYKRYHQWSNQILWKVPTFPDKPNEIFMESNLSQHYIFIILKKQDLIKVIVSFF